ncbi:hypothetical protein K8R78_08820 [bacterium]|nr:hypothetical protein [bacterium]
MNQTKNSGKPLSVVLGILQIFIGIGAVPAGLMMLLDPSGSSLGMPLSMLANTPFPNFLIPGIFLLMVNGIGSILGGLASFRRYRHADKIAVGLGVFLILWIVAQVWWMGIHWLHIMYVTLGVVELTLGLLLRKHLRIDSKNPAEDSP